MVVFKHTHLPSHQGFGFPEIDSSKCADTVLGPCLRYLRPAAFELCQTRKVVQGTNLSLTQPRLQQILVAYRR